MQMCSIPGGHADSNPRLSEEGVSFYHVLRPLDLGFVCMCKLCGLLKLVALCLFMEATAPVAPCQTPNEGWGG